MGREFEQKYTASPDLLARIRGDFGDFETVAMETAYYDTPDGVFSQRRMTLRCRKENDRQVCTLKTPGDGHGRGEWELECDDIRLAVPMLCKLAEISPPVISDLIQVCGARFTRLAKTLDIPGATAEIALDEGHLMGGGQKQPFWEVEVELKSGSEEALTAYADALAAKYGLQPQPKSKFQRAKALKEPSS